MLSKRLNKLDIYTKTRPLKADQKGLKRGGFFIQLGISCGVISSDHDPRTQTRGTPCSNVEAVSSSLYGFTDERQPHSKASLKYIGGYIQETVGAVS